MNGFEVCRTLRADGVWTPILVLTAKTGEWDEAEALDTGADDFLSKPFSFVVLVARLRALVRRGSTPRAGGAERRHAGARPVHPRLPPQRRRGAPHAPGVQRAGVAAAPRRRGDLEAGDPRRGVGPRVRRRPQHRRGLRALPPQARSTCPSGSTRSRPSATSATGCCPMLRNTIARLRTVRVRITIVATLRDRRGPHGVGRRCWSRPSSAACEGQIRSDTEQAADRVAVALQTGTPFDQALGRPSPGTAVYIVATAAGRCWRPRIGGVAGQSAPGGLLPPDAALPGHGWRRGRLAGGGHAERPAARRGRVAAGRGAAVGERAVAAAVGRASRCWSSSSAGWRGCWPGGR